MLIYLDDFLFIVNRGKGGDEDGSRRLRAYAEVQGRDDSLSYSSDNENKEVSWCECYLGSKIEKPG